MLYTLDNLRAIAIKCVHVIIWKAIMWQVSNEPDADAKSTLPSLMQKHCRRPGT